MTYNVFGGTLNLALSIYLRNRCYIWTYWKFELCIPKSELCYIIRNNLAETSTAADNQKKAAAAASQYFSIRNILHAAYITSCVLHEHADSNALNKLKKCFGHSQISNPSG